MTKSTKPTPNRKPMTGPEALLPVVKLLTWHHVWNKMPDDEQTVLLWGPSFAEVEIGYHDNGVWWINYAGYSRSTITHWAHLPETP